MRTSPVMMNWWKRSRPHSSLPNSWAVLSSPLTGLVLIPGCKMRWTTRTTGSVKTRRLVSLCFSALKGWRSAARHWLHTTQHWTWLPASLSSIIMHPMCRKWTAWWRPAARRHGNPITSWPRSCAIWKLPTVPKGFCMLSPRSVCAAGRHGPSWRWNWACLSKRQHVGKIWLTRGYPRPSHTSNLEGCSSGNRYVSLAQRQGWVNFVI